MSEIKSAKVVFLGSAGVGKSSLISRFITNEFSENLPATLGGSYFEKVYTYGEGKSVQFNFWDTAGQEKYRSLARVYYHQADVAVLMYGVNEISTFESLKTWMQELREKGPANIILVIIGNKIDLLDQQVPVAEAEKYAKSNGAIFKLISVKENKGIDDVFKSIAVKLQEPRQTTKPVGSKIGKDTAVNKKEKKSCC